MLSATSGLREWSSSIPRTSSLEYRIICLNSKLLEDPQHYKLVGNRFDHYRTKRTFGSNFVKHYTMSSPMHTRSGISLLPISTQPQSPYRLATPATLTTTVTPTTATTSTSSSTEISSTTASVVISTAPAPVISSVSTSSTVSMSAMSTVTSPVASVPFASSASSTAAASTFYLTTDPGIPGPGSFFGDDTQDPRDWIKTFQSWSNIKNFSEGTKIEIFKMLMKVNAARWIDTLQSSESDTFDHLKAAFFKRFIENDEWTDFIKMGQLRQESQEPVIAYLERALVLAKRVQLPEKHEIRALIQGLKPEIQTFVIQQKVVSYNALKEAALLAEKSLRPMSSTDDVISAFRHREKAIRNNQHVVPDTVQSVSPPTVTPLQTTENGQPLQSTRPQRTRYTSNQSPRQFPSQGAQQPRTTWNRPNRQPLTSGEQQQCYRCLKNHSPKNCSFVHSRCFYCGVTGHIKAACKRRLASQTSQQVSRATLSLQNYRKNSNQFYKFRELKLHPEKSEFGAKLQIFWSLPQFPRITLRPESIDIFLKYC